MGDKVIPRPFSFCWLEWLAGGRQGDPEAFLFLLPSVMSMVAIVISGNYNLKIIR